MRVRLLTGDHGELDPGQLQLSKGIVPSIESLKVDDLLFF